MQKTLYFVAGLPRSGSTMMINLLRQNPYIGGAAVSSLCTFFGDVYLNWNNIEPNREYPNEQAKIGVLRGILEGYHLSSKKQIIFDKDRLWVTKIALLESVLQREVKVLCPVRPPVEILSSFERLKRNNPTHTTAADGVGATTIASRCLFYSEPGGLLGTSLSIINDAITAGFLDRLLFVDYGKFCDTPNVQLKRIYDFFELPSFEHDFNYIDQPEIYNDIATNHPGLHKIKPKLEKTTNNCVDYLGEEVFQQYSSQVFWSKWI